MRVSALFRVAGMSAAIAPWFRAADNLHLNDAGSVAPAAMLELALVRTLSDAAARSR